MKIYGFEKVGQLWARVKLNLGNYNCPKCHRNHKLTRELTKEEGQMDMVHKPMSFNFKCETCNATLAFIK